MKTVSGTVVSSKPISISNAARVLSTFVSAENGASQAVSAYLRRASESFNELASLHRELKPPRSVLKFKKHRSETGRNPRQEGCDLQEQGLYDATDFASFGGMDDQGKKPNKRKMGVNCGSNVVMAEEEVGGGRLGAIDEKVTEKKRKKKSVSGYVQNGNFEERVDERSLGVEEKKKRRSGGLQGVVEKSVDGGSLREEEDKERKEKKKKKKKMKSESGDAQEGGREKRLDVSSLGAEEGSRKERKKRKSVEVQGVEVENSAERRSKKKRRIGTDEKV